MRRLHALLLVTLVARCSCDDPLNDLAPRIVVTPDRLDLGERYVGVANDVGYAIGNEGSARLRLESITIEPADDPPADAVDTTGAPFAALPTPVDVEIGASLQAVLRFTPPVRGLYAATLVVKSDDRERPLVRTAIVGEGGPPRVAAAPSPVDFGRVNEGPGAVQTVVVTNTGFDLLRISALRIRDGVYGFSLPDDFARTADVAPNATLVVPVRLDPRRDIVLADVDGILRDALVIESDAENAPLLEVPLQATANLAPVAVAVELVTRRGEYKTGVGREVVADGVDTVDPEGDPFTFAWTLASVPAGSAAFLVGTVLGPTCTDDAQCDVAGGFRCTDTGTVRCRQVARTRVTPDVVGTYVVRLRATDVHGAYSEDDLVILPRDLTLVLTWGPEANAPCMQYSAAECAAMSESDRLTLCCGQSDVDLHLLRPGGALGDVGTCPAECQVDAGAGLVENRCYEDGDAYAATCRQTGSDVGFANRYPEWGDAGRVDDPRLDLDDVRGDGPEVVSLDRPHDGTYTAVVHYCTDRIGEPSVARLQVYVQGVLTATSGPQLIDVEGEAWEAALLVRTGGPDDGGWVVTPQLNQFQTAPAGLCRE